MWTIINNDSDFYKNDNIDLTKRNITSRFLNEKFNQILVYFDKGLSESCI